MKRRRPPQSEIDRMCEAVTRLGNRTLAAEELGIPRNTLIRYTRHIPGSAKGGGFNPLHAHRHPERIIQATMGDVAHRPGREPIEVTGDPTGAALRAAEAVKPEPTPVRWTQKGDEATASFVSDRLIRTEKEALEYAEIDTSIWFVKAMEIGAWTTNMKLRAGQTEDKRWLADAGHTKQGWRISLSLARILPEPFRKASDAIFERQAAHAPAYPAIHRARPKAPHLLEIDLFDCHFGKLAWRAETGQDYDLHIAANVFRNAVEDLAGYAAGFEIDRVLLPIGNDFYHVDSLNSTTTSGTHVDSDGRYAKIIECGEYAVIQAIEYLRAIAPVSVIWVPGNHDRLASYHLARTVSAWFRQADDVDVDLSPKVRKYVRYSRNLLGYTHGHQEPHRGLPMLMALEEPESWAATTRRAWRVGHLHHSRKTETRSVAQYDNVSVQILQSLSGHDAYHFEKGFGSQRAAEAFILAADGGTAANFQVAARDVA